MTEETVCIGLARVSSETQKIVSGTLKELKDIGKHINSSIILTLKSQALKRGRKMLKIILDLGEPLHCFIVTGDLHPMEVEFLEKLKTVKN